VRSEGSTRPRTCRRPRLMSGLYTARSRRIEPCTICRHASRIMGLFHLYEQNMTTQSLLATPTRLAGGACLVVMVGFSRLTNEHYRKKMRNSRRSTEVVLRQLTGFIDNFVMWAELIFIRFAKNTSKHTRSCCLLLGLHMPSPQSVGDEI